MLAIVTLMAIVFLAMSRRERASVKVFEDMSLANYMAEAALERAKAEAVAGMAANGSKLYYDLFNSRNYINDSYVSQPLNSAPNPGNVSYLDQNGNVLTGPDYLRMLANLQYDARAPVFVETNSQTGGSDFRFYLDFNRNRFFETNGTLPDLDRTGVPIVTGTGPSAQTNVYRFVGDPEWIGMLERPELPHSETNRFIGRMAYLVLPAGKSLDLNHIHNHLDPSAPPRIDVLNTGPNANGFSRNQGVGSWEINLAGFLRELNTNNYAWHPASYLYRTAPGTLPRGAAFDDARTVLAFRYLGNRNFLKPASYTLGPINNGTGNIFQNNNIDDYGDGPHIFPGEYLFSAQVTGRLDNDDPDTPWPGSVNTNAFTDIQQLFSPQMLPVATRLQRPMTNSSSYDRYTFYRMAAQLGADSTPAIKDKLHLNFQNTAGQITNTYSTWTNAVQFFTNAADLMLRASIDRRVTNLVTGTVYDMIGDTPVRTNFSINNIQVLGFHQMNDPWSTNNEYTSTIHRILQVAANIYDNMTNRTQVAGRSYYPTVFRPLFTKTATGMIISGFEEMTNANALNLPWREIEGTWRTNSMGNYWNNNFYGQHLVIGAKKGHPNFNELALQTLVEISRKLEVIKPNAALPPTQTNQMFLVSMIKRWGMEGWNSYTNPYNRSLSISGEVLSSGVIRDANVANVDVWSWGPVRLTETNSITINNWAAASPIIETSTNFAIVFDRRVPHRLDPTVPAVLDEQVYSRTPIGGLYFRPKTSTLFLPMEPSPRFVVYSTNKVRFWMIDQSVAPARVIDFVSFDNLVTVTDLTTNLYSLPTSAQQLFGGQRSFNENMFWDPTPVPGQPNLTVGITNQMAVSSGEIEVDDNTWRAFTYSSPDKRGGIAGWRKFVGLPLRSTDPNVPPSIAVETRRQAPFVPTRRIHQLTTWQANDPLVHYMLEDLTRLPNSDKPENLPILQPPPAWNIGRLNDVYRPWGGNPLEDPKNNPYIYNVGFNDPGIRRSDDWQFPISTNFSYQFPNIGALGQVHRGTPWQTLYLKSVYQIVNGQPVPFVHPSLWRTWAGRIGTYPMSDWKLLDCFTAAANENAARGLLSVNQNNRAAWSAVLSGIVVPTNSIPSRNLSGLGKHEGADPAITYQAITIEPASNQISNIVESINYARTNQFQVITNPNWAANPARPFEFVPRTNQFIPSQTLAVFESVGDILSAPHLTVQSPFLNPEQMQIQKAITDRAVEYIPQQILSLLQRDEPRFVVYAFGQALKPAPNSLSTHASFYNLCTNYQITGEVVTKTTFRVEGELGNRADPLRAVVESYNILPPPE